MVNFEIYGKFKMQYKKVLLQDVIQILTDSIWKHFREHDFSVTQNGFNFKGNLKSIWERAITKADIQIKIDGRELSYKVTGTSSLGEWPWVWCILGFVTGFFFFVFIMNVIEYIICRDRPKKYLEEAFQACKFELGWDELKEECKDIDYLEQAIRIKPSDADMHYNLGLAYSKLGHHTDAIEAYHKAITIKPDFAEAHNAIGSAYIQLGQWQEATESFNQAIRIKPTESEAHYHLGLAKSKLGQHTEAIKSFQEAIKIKQDFAEAHNACSAPR